jgi:hypothetical protein
MLALGACTPRPTPVDYFPLGVGHDWLYRISAPGKDTRLLQFKIVREAPGDRGETRFLLDESGSRYYLRHGDLVAYSISPDIWTIFLSGPLKRGSRFDGALAVFEDFAEPPEGAPSPTPPAGPPVMRTVASSGYKVVTETGRRITVPAGDFDDCLEVTHLAGPTTGVKYFAPGVGMVFAEAWFVDPDTKVRALLTRQELVGYRIAGRTGGSLDFVLAPLAPRTTDSSTP